VFKISHNGNQISLAIEKKMAMKKAAFGEAAKIFIIETEKDAKSNLASSDSPEKADMINTFKKKFTKNTYSLYVDSKQAPFVEFGSKSKFTPPDARVAALAAEWKGTKMDFKDLVRRFMETLNIDEDEAKRRASGILRNGNTPRPFFFPAVFENTKKLENKLKNILKE
jgi:hypothetical protein